MSPKPSLHLSRVGAMEYSDFSKFQLKEKLAREMY